MKKRISIILLLAVLAVLLACLPASSLAATSVTLADKVSFSAGYTTISWTASGADESKYVVWVEAVGGSANQGQYKVGETSNNKIQTSYMIPSKTYKVLVKNSSGITLGTKTYTMKDPKTYKDGGMNPKAVKITIELQRQENSLDDPKKTSKLKSGAIMNALDNGKSEYGVKYHIKMPNLKKERNYLVQIAMEAPDGYLETVVYKDMTFKKVRHGYQNIWWNLLGAGFFENMYRIDGTVPSGKYYIYMFWDGELVNTSNFTVN